ncbi:hypothetical protein [Microbispora bryophytorum]|uniref:hypothetical protein n=1 Tax=Microbispora bryophytorum TaxID=1460882 RepID=UPI0033CD0C0C
MKFIRIRVVVTGENVTALKVFAVMPQALAPVTFCRADPVQYYTEQDAGRSMP